MATRFLLPCACGREIEVDAGQAGDTARCACGSTVLVPKLGELRLLPRVETVAQRGAWSPWHGLMTLAGLIAIFCGGLGVYFWATTPKGQWIDLPAEKEQVAAFFDALSADNTWMYWHQRTAPTARLGFQDEPNAQMEARDAQIERGRTLQRVSFGAAGLALLFCIVVAVWRPASRRLGPRRP